MQIRFIQLVKFSYYKSSKFGVWVGKVADIFLSRSGTICFTS